MLQEFRTLANDMDDKGNPDGGMVEATGLLISWQKGPLGRGQERQQPNGAFVETVLKACEHRLEFYQASKFACAENAGALALITGALDLLNSRTKSREKRGVEGTHVI